jgi:hypothetical protein
MADTSVKYLDSTMQGAPTLSGTAGSLIGILDAVLVTGFATSTPDSVVVAGGICTVTRNAGHPFQVGMVALLAGAVTTGAGSLNGEQKVAAITATSYTFATTVSDQAASGTITQKVAPAGWVKKFAGTNLAVYQSNDVQSTKMCLRVDDTGTTSARITAFETMTDINTGTGQFPTSAQQAGGLFWDKSNTANATVNTWQIAADSRFLMFARGYRSGNLPTETPATYQISAFGDIVPTKAGDAFACIISGATSSQAGGSLGATDGVSMASTAPNQAALGLFMPRSFTALGSSIAVGRANPSLTGAGTQYVSGSVNAPGPSFPNTTDGGLYVTQQYIYEITGSAPSALRGFTPGWFVTPQITSIAQFNARDVVTGVNGLPGKALRAFNILGSGPSVAFIDSTGPWR